MASPRNDEDEDPEFRRAVADAKPLRHKKRVSPPRGASPMPKQTLLDERAALSESLGPLSLDDALESGNELTYLREGHPRDLLRKLRRGHWVVQDELDLHGMNRHAALLSVTEFLKESRKQQVRCVRIIHGKGRGSRQREPVLKGLLRKWLVRADVLAFSQAPANQGGSGAVLVLLRA
jgi:DNA-nicking Smr family endonuclease